ncbi:MAG: acyltransferase [Paludibacteraceae bacterium]|nr:acyltransferase [Paludibacteraceae bacterium]
MGRDNCFDFLRFTFALNVVLGHLFAIALIPEFEPLKGIFNTYLSVTGFFVISGFLIAQSYERSSSLKSYFIKRARRLLPAYLLVVLGCAFGLASLSSLPIGEYFTSKDLWEYIGANLCFLNFLHPSLPGVFDHPLISDTSVNPALWTLKIEVGFYLCVPVILWGLRKSKRPWLWLIIIYVLAVVYKLGLEHLAEQWDKPFIAFVSRQLPGFMSYFAVGMCGYMYKNNFMQYKKHMIIPAVLIFIIEHLWAMEVLTPLAWGIIVLWCAWSLPALNNFAKYGDVSYGIYIYHGPILKILLTIGLFTQTGVWPAAAVYIVCVILTGLASWHLMEKHFLKRTQR